MIKKIHLLDIPSCLLRSPVFLTLWDFFYFRDRPQKKWVLFKMQQGKPLASNYLERFPIEKWFKHMGWGPRSGYEGRGLGLDNPNTTEKLIWYAVYLMSKSDSKIIKVILQISSFKGVIQWLHWVVYIMGYPAQKR